MKAVEIIKLLQQVKPNTEIKIQCVDCSKLIFMDIITVEINNDYVVINGRIVWQQYSHVSESERWVAELAVKNINNQGTLFQTLINCIPSIIADDIESYGIITQTIRELIKDLISHTKKEKEKISESSFQSCCFQLVEDAKAGDILTGNPSDGKLYVKK
jgi:hypothetical protein